MYSVEAVDFEREVEPTVGHERDVEHEVSHLAVDIEHVVETLDREVELVECEAQNRSRTDQSEQSLFCHETSRIFDTIFGD